MVKFQLEKSQYINMMRVFRRHRLFILTPTIYGSAWIVCWILLAIAKFDTMSSLGALALLFLILIPHAAVLMSLFLMKSTTRQATRVFESNSSMDGQFIFIQCELSNGTLSYYNELTDKCSKIILASAKNMVTFKNFFIVISRGGVCYPVPLTNDTYPLYESLKSEFAKIRQKGKGK